MCNDKNIAPVRGFWDWLNGGSGDGIPKWNQSGG